MQYNDKLNDYTSKLNSSKFHNNSSGIGGIFGSAEKKNYSSKEDN